jgi:hypothetical protein
MQSGGGPCGALEITPEGTRYIHFEDLSRTGIALALGFIIGAAVVFFSAARRGHARPEVNPPNRLRTARPAASQVNALIPVEPGTTPSRRLLSDLPDCARNRRGASFPPQGADASHR